MRQLQYCGQNVINSLCTEVYPSCVLLFNYKGAYHKMIAIILVEKAPGFSKI